MNTVDRFTTSHLLLWLVVESVNTEGRKTSSYLIPRFDSLHLFKYFKYTNMMIFLICRQIFFNKFILGIMNMDILLFSIMYMFCRIVVHWNLNVCNMA